MGMRIFAYRKDFLKRYESMRRKIILAAGKVDIHHVGSTSVKGLGGKGIVDILIGVKNWNEAKVLVVKLRKIGFTHRDDTKRRIFLSGEQPTTIGDTHIHIVIRNSSQYREFLGFRDYMRHSKKARNDYMRIKEVLLKETGADREKYKLRKARYVKKILREMKAGG